MSRLEERVFGGTERFEIRRRLGAGGMGAVYEAFDRERRATVALKTLRRDDARSREQLQREFNILRSLTHPNLVSLGELIEAEDGCFFTMELIEGDDFVAHVRPDVDDAPTDTVSYDEPRLRAALPQLAQAIAAIHLAGKLHRDIKPPNILVTKEGRVVLLDFGLVTEIALEDQSSPPEVAGTISHMAPEQALNDNVGPAADWYALGAVLYEALTGHLPHSGESHFELLQKKQHRMPPPPRQRVPQVAADLDELCVELLQIDPARRPPAQEILDRLGVPGSASRPRERQPAGSLPKRDAPFVGRERELAALHKAYTDSQKQGPVAIFVHGESGLGKTELVAQFVRTLETERSELLVLSGRCHERAVAPYGAFSGIATALSQFLSRLSDTDATNFLPPRAGLLPLLFPALLQVKAIAVAPMQDQSGLDPHEQRTRMFAAFRELLARVARDRLVVALIDDLQWAAPDSLTLLSELMQSKLAPELLLIGTARPGVQVPLDRRISGDVRHVQLEELSQERACELVMQLAPRLSSSQAAAIADEADGHPMFIQELVHHLAGGGRAGSLRLGEALWLRISELEPNPARLLRVLALAGGPIAQETAAAAADLGYGDYERAMAELRTGSLGRTGRLDANTVEPYHDRVREAVLGHLDGESLAQGHRELGVALEQSGAGATDPQILVQHFTAANDPQRAAKHAETAALRARAMSAFDQAASLFSTALALGEHDEAPQRALRLELGQALVAAGRGPEAADIFLLAAEGAGAQTRFECRRQATEQLLISGHLERALESLHKLLAELGVSAPTTPRRALFSLLWQRAKLRLRGFRWKERAQSQIRPDALTQVELYRAAGHGYAMIHIIRGADFQARGLLLALRTGERSRVARAIFHESIYVGTGGPKRLGRARALLAKATAIAAPLRDPYLQAWSTAADSSLHYFNGEFRVAVEGFGTAEREFRELAGATWELSTVRLLRLWSLHRIGALAELTPLLREYVRDAERRGDRHARTTLVRSCHRVLLNESEEGAQQQLERADWVPVDNHYHLQHWYLFASRAEFSLFHGTSQSLMDDVLENDRRIRQSLLLRVHPVRMDFQWLRARLILASSASGSARASELREVKRLAHKLDSERVGYAAVTAKMLRAAIATQQESPERACEQLRATVEQAEQQDMLLHAGAAQYRLGELLGGDEGRELITEGTVRIQSEGCVDVARMAEMLAPGFDLK